ncbi:MAG: threonine synthase [Candidatus Rokubacteria bacterium]|nr:threonine synthase [Candidatus Rokubacteria bacterium]
MGLVKAVRCPRCEAPAAGDNAGVCSHCGTVVDLVMDLTSVPSLAEIRRRAERSIWKWRELLPIQEPAAIVSLGEGYTPLIEARRLGERLGIPRLYVKNDGLLPTGSLKDRVNALAVSRGREMKVPLVATPSTGNAAASLAAYAAAGGLACIVLVPEGTAPAKVAQARICGARVVAVRGAFDTVAALARQAIERFGWYSALSDNPWRNAGHKSYGYEVLDQLGEVPDWMIHPEASGGAVAGTWKAFGEMQELGWVRRKPRMVAAQAEAAAPLVRAWEKGLTDVEPVTPGPTVAEAIKVGQSRLGWQCLAALRDAGGTAVAVADDEILEAQRLLAALEGVFAEPAGAVSIAAARRLSQSGAIGPKESVVAVVTGHGLKQLVEHRLSEIPTIEPTLEALEQAIKGGAPCP